MHRQVILRFMYNNFSTGSMNVNAPSNTLQHSFSFTSNTSAHSLMCGLQHVFFFPSPGSLMTSATASLCIAPPDLGNVVQNCRKHVLVHHFDPVNAPMSPQSYTFISILVMCLKNHIQIIALVQVLIQFYSWFYNSGKQILCVKLYSDKE